MRLLVALVALSALLAPLAAGQVLTPVSKAYMDRDSKNPFAINEKAKLWVALNMQPCSAALCRSDQCTSTYCGRQPDGSCSGPASATFAVQISIPIACCSNTANKCDKGRLGGSLTVTAIPQITLTGPAGGCESVPNTANQTWADLGAVGLLQPTFCNSDEEWFPLLSANKISSTPTVATISLEQGNNPDLALFVSLTVAITSESVLPPQFPAAASYTFGPIAGLVASSLSCLATGNIATPPPSSCTGVCGCLAVTLKSREIVAQASGPGTVGSRYTLEVCALCEGLSLEYLALAAPPGASGLLVQDMGQEEEDGQVYEGEVCSYTVSNGTCLGFAPWPDSLCWTTVPEKKCTKKFQNGKCDTLVLNALGVAESLELLLTGKAGVAGATQSVTLAGCTSGSEPPQLPSAPYNCDPATKAYGAACDQCLFPPSAAATATAVAYCVPIDGGVYRWLLVPSGAAVPSGAFPPGTADPATGFATTCACGKLYRNCSTDCTANGKVSGNCLCDNAVGLCKTSGVCMASSAPCNVGQGNASCPATARGMCNGNGACVCGACQCTSNGGVSWTGAACDVPDDCSRYADCSSCAMAGAVGLGCSWCRLGTGAACLNNATCDNIGGAQWSCDGQLVVSTGACPGACTCYGERHGVCQLAEGVGTCDCDEGWSGVDCCSRSSDPDKRRVGGIVGGVIAAIVIAGVILFVATGAGVKVAMHFARVRRLLAAARDNPIYGDEGAPSPQASASSLPAGDASSCPPPPVVTAPDEASGQPEAVGDSEAD